ncbi:hypothetical protein [Pseudalkalibacillus caeni]|uniref:hypothetical protein n=1 Tax=Exobacillus caeni TaxID=2574798 RepID=UPI0014854920|nr:hypothetical protein [Pseudalkalibacillus caeni]
MVELIQIGLLFSLLSGSFMFLGVKLKAEAKRIPVRVQVQSNSRRYETARPVHQPEYR